MNMTTTTASPFSKIGHVLETARKAPNTILSMSRKDCHCKGLDSIVIADRADGRLVRVYVAHPGSEINKPNNDGLVVGIHNHRYPLRLLGLAGMCFNIEYSISPMHPLGGAPWDLFLNAYRFGKMGQDIKSCGKRRVRRVSETRIDDIILPAESLHTVVVGERGGVWAALEGPEIGGDTICLSDRDLTKWSPEGLYREFDSPKDALAVLEDALGGVL